MNFLELVGAIFVRSQLIEQKMRDILLEKKAFIAPENFDKKTFGWLLDNLLSQYPGIKDNPVPEEWREYHDASLYASLEDARDIRNEAAHGYYLMGVSLRDLMPDNHTEKVDRLTLKSIRKSVTLMDDALISIHNYQLSLKK